MPVCAIRSTATDRSTCLCRGAPSRPPTTAADGKTASGPGTGTGRENRAETGTERGRETGKGNEREEEREKESVIGQRSQWTLILRFEQLSLFYLYDMKTKYCDSHITTVSAIQYLKVWWNFTICSCSYSNCDPTQLVARQLILLYRSYLYIDLFHSQIQRLKIKSYL